MKSAQKTTISTIEISTLPQFLEEVEKLPRSQHLFRGQGQDHPLKPKIARLTPLDGRTLESMERQMLADLKRRAGSWFKDTVLRPDNDWDWLALAQHHGMATRLLDWSDNPLTALFFAVEKVFDEKKATRAKCPVVWVFRVEEDALVNPDEKDQTPFNMDRTRVFRPNHVTPRIVAQNGWFTIHPYRRKNELHRGFIPLETNINYKPFLTKFTITPANVGDIRRMLRTCGVHVGSVYPGLEGLCADITERFTHRDDESNRIGGLQEEFETQDN